MVDVYVYVIHFQSHAVHEFVVPCADGYTIYIDEDLDQTRREEEYQHAMEHIRRMDWEKEDVQEIEAAAHHIEVMVPENRKEDNAYVIRARKRAERWAKELDRKKRKYQKRLEFIEKYYGSSSDYALKEHDRALWDF